MKNLMFFIKKRLSLKSHGRYSYLYYSLKSGLKIDINTEIMKNRKRFYV